MWEVFSRSLAVLVLVALCVIVFGGTAWAVYGVRISDLGNSPQPPNPIKVWGRVTSESPLKIGDGRAEVTVSGPAASVGDFLVLTGDWDGSVLTVSGPSTALMGPTKSDMIYIPAGSFLMGNSGVGDDAAYGYSNELPQHSVYLSGYWIGKCEVTRGEYRQFMNAGGYSNPAYWSTDGWNWRADNSRTEPDYWAANQDWWGGQPFTQTDNHPVVGVTYHEAEAFCNWAGGHLPTEAQWEKAARWTGSYPNVYPWGNTWDVEKCNDYYDTNPAGGGYQRCQTAPVGSYPSGASPYGLQDMAGNVWEWCQDWFKSYPGSSSPFDKTNSLRVARGGGWHNPDYFRCAHRASGCDPAGRWATVGFRIAR